DYRAEGKLIDHISQKWLDKLWAGHPEMAPRMPGQPVPQPAQPGARPSATPHPPPHPAPPSQPPAQPVPAARTAADDQTAGPSATVYQLFGQRGAEGEDMHLRTRRAVPADPSVPADLPDDGLGEWADEDDMTEGGVHELP